MLLRKVLGAVVDAARLVRVGTPTARLFRSPLGFPPSPSTLLLLSPSRPLAGSHVLLSGRPTLPALVVRLPFVRHFYHGTCFGRKRACARLVESVYLYACVCALCYLYLCMCGRVLPIPTPILVHLSPVCNESFWLVCNSLKRNFSSSCRRRRFRFERCHCDASRYARTFYLVTFLVI